MKEFKKKLKIAVFVNQFPCLSETFILNQVVYLIKQGHLVDIYSIYREQSQPVHTNIYRYNLLESAYYFTIPSKFWVRVKLFLSSFFRAHRKLELLDSLNFFKYGIKVFNLRQFYTHLHYTRPYRYDIIHAHFGPRGIDVINLKKQGVFKNVPLLTTFHGYDINPLYVEDYKIAYRCVFDESQFITANSNFTIELLKLSGCDQNKIVKLPVSLDSDYFSRNDQIEKSYNDVNVVFCGRLIEFKAPDLFVKIANRLINNDGVRNVKFHIVGDGPLRQALVNQIVQYGLEKYVIMHGPMVQENIIRFLSSMDIFLYPGIYDEKTGRSENQGLVLQEAQALELPVITSNVGGISEGLIDGVSGFIVAEKSIEMFTEKLHFLIDNVEIRQLMGKSGRSFIVHNFDIQVLGKKLEEIFYLANER